MTYEIAALIANIALALSLIVVVVFGIVQVRAAARDRFERLTLEALHNFQTREFAEMIAQITYHKMPSSFQEFQQLQFHDQAKFIQFAQEMEALGIMVAERLINIDLVDKTLGSFVTTSGRNTKRCLWKLGSSNPILLGEYFQWLAELINKRMSKYPRQPFYETQRTSVGYPIKG